MTGSRETSVMRVSLEPVVKECRFQDGGLKTGKWFRGRGDLFRWQSADETFDGEN
ncbi:MAG: hypothetical protein NT113_10320 [Hyphomicrobiales bacterium]|nr:hypothetical protein [Hyphomicrobiales bacterium]